MSMLKQPAPEAKSFLHAHHLEEREIEHKQSGESHGSALRPNAPTILFAMLHLGFYRNFAQAIERLCAAGINVQVRYAKRHKSISGRDYQFPQGGAGGFEVRRGGYKAGEEWIRSARVRMVRDVLLYSRDMHQGADNLQERFADMQQKGLLSAPAIARLRRLGKHFPGWINSIADRVLGLIDLAIRPAPAADSLLEKMRPGLVVVTPFVNFGADEIDLVKAARRRGIPTMLAVASWDNLTNKGLIHVQPDRVAVWNRHMAREARELHGVPPDNITIVGASVFDDWFDRQPTNSRVAFCERLGFDPGKPIVVYLCSAGSIVGANERSIVEAWAAAVRSCPDSRIKNANLLMRPHPMSLGAWKDELKATSDKADLGPVTVWPVHSTHPTLEEGRSEFFDTLYHADAVVGLNTSAMIEATILNKPVLTFVGHAASKSQTGNLHFRYLVESGCIRLAATLEDHVGQLAAVMHGQGCQTECERFVSDFLRPMGRHKAASAVLAEEMMAMVGVTVGAQAGAASAEPFSQLQPDVLSPSDPSRPA